MAILQNLSPDDDNLLPEIAFIARNLDMLQFQIDFMLDHCKFQLMPTEFYNSVYEIKKSILKSREVYVNSLRFIPNIY